MILLRQNFFMKKITLLIIDDQRLIRETWSLIFSQDGRFETLAHTGDANDAITIARERQPDIVLLDINMAPMNGFEILKMIRKFSPSSKIIGVSMHLQPHYARKMLREGAKGYVSKGSTAEELFKAVEEVHKGNTYVSEDVKDILAKQWTDDSITTGVNSLSGRELEVIKLIRSGHSSKIIAEMLHIHTKTVEVHRHNILKKLKVKNTASLIQLVNSYGL